MKFNTTKKPDKSENYEGGEAFDPSPEHRLYKLTVNNLLENTYYRSDEEAVAEVMAACQEVDTEFILKLAAYARREMYLRDIPQLLLVIAAGREDNELVKEYSHIIDRADEPMTVISAWEHVWGPITFEDRARQWLENQPQNSEMARLRRAVANGNVKKMARAMGVYQDIKRQGRSLPKPLQHAIEDALHNFDSYQFAKYDTDRREVNMKDVLNLVHPTPRTDRHDEIFERLIYGELDDYPEIEPLETPKTWETVISERGNHASAWHGVLPEMGLFAKIRNIRNMINAGVHETDIFSDDDWDYIEKADFMPFRFYQAYKAVEYRETPEVDAFLEYAVSENLQNVHLPNSLVAVDLSRSMYSSLSDRSNMTYKEIAAFLGAVGSYQKCDVVGFATRAEEIEFESENVFDRTNEILRTIVGSSTYGHKALEYFDRHDRIIMLTDMQIYSRDRSLRQKYGSEAPLYMVDLSSYGDLKFPEGRSQPVYNISGWNDKIFQFIKAEESENPLAEIRNY